MEGPSFPKDDEAAVRLNTKPLRSLHGNGRLPAIPDIPHDNHRYQKTLGARHWIASSKSAKLGFRTKSTVFSQKSRCGRHSPCLSS